MLSNLENSLTKHAVLLRDSQSWVHCRLKCYIEFFKLKSLQFSQVSNFILLFILKCLTSESCLVIYNLAVGC